MYTWGECQVVRVFQLSKMLLDLVLFCCFFCVFLIRERFVLPKFVFCHEFGLYCFCCALSRSCRYYSKFRRFKPICFFVLFVLVVEMHYSVLQEISPYEKLYGVKPSMDLIHVFGCHAFAHVSVDSQLKTDAKSRATINLGTAKNLNGFLLYDPIMRNTFQCSSVLFDEYAFGISELKE